MSRGLGDVYKRQDFVLFTIAVERSTPNTAGVSPIPMIPSSVCTSTITAITAFGPFRILEVVSAFSSGTATGVATISVIFIFLVPFRPYLYRIAAIRLFLSDSALRTLLICHF